MVGDLWGAFVNYVPSLQANYTPVPHTFLQLVLGGKLGREAVVAMLYLFSKTYGWKQEKGFASVDDLVHGASLTAEEALQGLREAISHEMVLEMPLDPGAPDGTSMYLLNTIENRRFMDAYVTASQEVPVPEAVRQAPGALEEGSIEAPPDMEPVLEEVSPPGEPPAPPRVETSRAEASPAAAGPPPAPESNEPYEDWGYTYRTVEMVIRLLGRVPTKDERVRLRELGASDVELIEAMGRLIEKKVDIYSSDLIVYEHEALKSAQRRKAKDVERREVKELRETRRKTCRTCDGLGYVFIGVSGIQECEACRN